MNYTIASIDDVHGEITVDFGKSGNGYTVSIWHKELKESAIGTYAAIAEAQSVFVNLTNAILTGCYSYEQRKAMLK